MAEIDSTVDVHCLDDFLPSMPTVSGRVALVQRSYRRLTTPRGRFPFWPNFGFDLRVALLSKLSPDFVEREAQAELEEDEQCLSATVSINVVGTDWVASIGLVDAEGPFEFTLTISEAKVSLGTLLERA